MEPGAWTLSGARGADSLLSGAGQAPETVVTAGEVALSEASAEDRAPGYTASAWTCQQAEGTVPGGSAYSTTVSSTAGTGAGTVTVRNQDRVVCTIANTAQPATLTWTKTDPSGRQLAGSEWTLTPTDPAGAPVTVVDNGTGDQDPADGALSVTGLPWGTYTLEETRAPAGYQRLTSSTTVTVTGASTDLTASAGQQENRPVPVSLSWRKTDGTAALSGSEWSLTGTGIDASAIDLGTITDCTGTCTGLSDTDAAAGSFTLTGLTYGTYTLTETRAPAGFVRDDTATRTITIAADPDDATRAVVTVTGPQGTTTKVSTGSPETVSVSVGEITNDKAPVPGLPLTGGMGTDTFLMAAGVAALLALLAAGLVTRRRRASQA
nr:MULTISPECIES: SpaA isopeptide-forming pilin-related protein [unclassified Actinomyces]